MEDTVEVLDLSHKKFKKLSKPTPQEAQATTLILDDNELQRLDCIDSFQKLQTLSVVRNQLLRMYGVCRLHMLHTLNLSYNGILSIEGLRDLVNLKHLCLAGNTIKTIEHLNTNVNLRHLDLSENNISYISDLSFLKNLEELLLHNNKINHLRQCDRFLPTNLSTLTLASNKIEDLNEISVLTHLKNLNSISIENNPCVVFTAGKLGFDYRPFIVNWLMNVRIIDGSPVDAIESLRAEWLYSQGRGRHFRIGDQQELQAYLASVCPLTAKTLETEENRKLRLILSKAKHHQLQLKEQSSDSETPIPSPLSRKKLQSVESEISKLSSTFIPDRMISSCYASTNKISNSSIMSQSLDPSMLRQSSPKLHKSASANISNGDVEKCLDVASSVSSPLQALSKLVPVPESLMSPDYRPPPLTTCKSIQSTIPTKMKTPPNSARSPKPNRTQIPKQKITNSPLQKNTPVASGDCMTEAASILRKSPSSEEESEICDSKLQSIQMKIEKSKLLKTESEADKARAESAAVYIQKVWRGYCVRNKNKQVQEIYRIIQSQRADQYIHKLAADMESTKAALESERKIQMLQMQAINALWKKVSSLQPEAGDGPHCSPALTSISENSEVVKDLAQTCSLLQSQIQQLQGSMQDIIKFMNIFSQTTPVVKNLKEKGTATQTEISAVHTPQGENAKVFPFQKVHRPSSLPLPVSQKAKKEDKQQQHDGLAPNQELRQFAGSLVDGVIKTVSETKADCFGEDTTEITVTDTDKGFEASEAHAEVNES